MSNKIAVVVAFALVSVACGASLKSIDFNVQESGHPVAVKKFFNDGFGGDGPESRAFNQTQKGDVAGAKKTLEDAIAQNPKNEWAHYDLGILHEATAEWEKAEAEMKAAEAIDPKDSRFKDELNFIAAHRAK